MPIPKMTQVKTSDLIWQDTQHNMLFRLLDALCEDPYDPEVITKLKLYAEHHFSLEEAYMEKLDYAGKAGHIAAHNKFREEIKQLEDAQAANGMTPELRAAASRFLSEWLTRHVLGIDKDFEEFVLNSDHK